MASLKTTLCEDGTDNLKWVDEPALRDNQEKYKPYELEVSKAIKITDIHIREADPPKVECHARIILHNFIAVDFTLFTRREGRAPFGRFRGKLNRAGRGQMYYYQDAPLIDPKTGRISFRYTHEIEQEIAKHLQEGAIDLPEVTPESAAPAVEEEEPAVEEAAEAAGVEGAEDKEQPPWEGEEKISEETQTEEEAKE